MPTIQPFKVEQNVRKGQKARWPYMSDGDYQEPKKEGYAFIGWKFNDTICRPPFDDETQNPFGPVNQDMSIYAVWDKVVSLNISSNNIEVNPDGGLVEIEYWGDTLTEQVFSNGITFEIINVAQEGKQQIRYNEKSEVVESNNKLKKTIQILPNDITEPRYLKIRVSFDDITSSIIEITQSEGEETPYFPPIVEGDTGTASLKMLQYGIDTKAKFRLAADFDKTSGTSKEWAFSCAGSTYAEFVRNNTGGLTITGSNTIDDYSMVDDYGILFKRTDGYGRWQGGTTSSPTYNRTFNISPVNDSSIVRQVIIQGYADENNNILVRGDVVNKAIRVPSSGMSGIISTCQYPYTFDSVYYYTNPRMSYVTKISSTELRATSDTDGTIEVDGFNASLENVNDNSIEYNFSYVIRANSTGDYKYHMVVINSKASVLDTTTNLYGKNSTNNSNIVMLHFIQEYKVRNRIYYGKGFSTKSFDDNYNSTSGNVYKYHSWFETCSSKILTDNSFTVEVDSTYVAYPNSEDFEYDFGLTNGGDTTVVSTNYMWGDTKYKIVTIPSENKAIFTRK